MSGPERPRFAADEMLGSLAKWLRIMGYDTSYCKGMEDREITLAASSEGRRLLTRDKDLAKRSTGSTYVESDVLEEQVMQVVQKFDLHFEQRFTRCAICNGNLDQVEKDSVLDEVPPRSLQMTDEFYRCSSCGKVYWKGTHWKNMMERMADFGVQDRSLL